MRKIKLACISLMALTALAGCTTGPELALIGGRYYLTNDKNCKQWSGADSDNQISCYDKNTQYTGERTAMNGAAMQIYISSQQNQAAAAAEAVTNYRQPVIPNYEYTPMGVQAQTPTLNSQRTYDTHYCYDLSGNMIACKKLN